MLLGGLWHGASWKFVFWGFIHGLGLAIEKAFNLHNIFNKSSLLKFFGWAITFHIVCLAWIFFRADNFDKAIMMIDKIIFNTDFNMITQFSIAYKPIFLIILLGYAMHFINNELEDFLKISLFETHFVFQMIIVFIILFITLQFKSQDIQPFIYFQF
jgi:D-alanyl-lipoteichoic acid acyltransferase DltB (MBOAT superfamily)